MALVTIQRSPSPSTDQDLDVIDSAEDVSEGKSQIRKRSKTSKEKLRKIFSTVRFISKLRPCLSESYFTVKGAALILPHTECTKKASKKSHGGEIQSHLQAMLHLLRPEDTIKIAVRLEDVSFQHHRYMALVSTRGRQDTEEAVILGIDCTGAEASIGLVLPVWLGLRIKLGGDGGFSLCTDEQAHLFKPVSVQAMWSAIQSLVKALHTAEEMKYIHDGLTHTWVGYYKSRIDRRDPARNCQWNVEGVEVFAPSSLSIKSEGENEKTKLIISQRLKEVMMTVDLDEATSIGLRTAVEEKMGGISLEEFKGYFDEEVMRILGQMDEPSMIVDFLYLGSEWNASNLEELKEKGIGYILNVTKEIDNFFVGMFHYFNVRVQDVEEADLLKHWDKTYKFIDRARNHQSKVLVHCKMGVSRSASTVMAFLMKDRRWTVEEAFQFVKGRRSCVHPNDGFMEQLHMYQAILTASNKRDIFRSKSDQNLLDEGIKEETEQTQGSFLGDSLFHMMSHSDWPAASGGVAYEEEWIHSLHKEDTDMLPMDTDLETAESRSADSMEESLPDLPSPSHVSGTTSGTPTVTVTPAAAGTGPAQSFRPLGSGQVPERSPDPESSTDSDAHSARCSSEGSDRTATPHHAALGQPLRIKPDSSWIRLDSVDADEEKDSLCPDNLPYIDAPSSDSQQSQTTPTPSVSTLAAAVSINSISVPVAGHDMSGSREDRYQSGEGEEGGRRAQFTLGNEQQDTQKSKSDVPEIVVSLDVAETPSVSTEIRAPPWKRADSAEPKNLVDQSATRYDSADKKSQEEERLVGGEKVEKEPARPESLTLQTGGGAAGGAPASPASPRSPLGKLEPGVRQYLREKIPWKPGKVRKIQEDINKMGQIFHDDPEDEESGEERQMDTPADEEMAEDRALLDSMSEHSGATLSQSRSCMELFTPGEAGTGPMTLYEREEIPMEPGTVLRTRLEIEERQRLFCGEGDQEIFGSARPVVRTSSLKHEKDTPRSRYTDNRRLTCGPIMSPISGKSLDDLRGIGVSEVDLADFSLLSPDRGEQKDKTDMKSSMLTSDREKATGHTAAQSDVHTVTSTSASFGTVSGSAHRAGDGSVETDSRNKHPETPMSQTSQGKRQSNFDPETLALIREIGSALLMSPTPPKPADNEEEESCSNMVKYFVRKIEKQTKISKPTRNIILIESDSKKSGQPGDAGSARVKSVSPNEDVVNRQAASSFQPVVSPGDICGASLSHGQGGQASDVHVRGRDRHSATMQGGQTTSSELGAVRGEVGGAKSGQPHSVAMAQSDQDAGVFVGQAQTKASDSVAVAGNRKSPHSPSQCCGSESPDASVVRHLVGRFEIRSPESERSSSEPGTEFSSLRRDSTSSLSPLADRKLDKREDMSGTASIGQPLTDFLPIDSYPSQASVAPSAGHLSIPTTTTMMSSSVPSSTSSLLSLHRKHASLDSSPWTVTSSKPSPLTFDIARELCQPASTKKQIASVHEKDDTPQEASSDVLKPKSGPVPFSLSGMEIPENKTWRPVRPKSAEQPQRSRSSSDSVETPSQAPASNKRTEERYQSIACDDDISLRQVSDEGRKIRRLHGKTHPLTKLTGRFGKGPFYSSM